MAAGPAAGWTADEVPMSDGGEGLLDALGGDPRHTAVTGPLGKPVDAEWRMLTTSSHGTTGRRPTHRRRRDVQGRRPGAHPPPAATTR